MPYVGTGHRAHLRISHTPDAPPKSSLTFYPAYCNKASPTWFTWVKLTAWDIHHRLEAKPDYHTAQPIVSHDGFRTSRGWRSTDSLLLFYLNHPIHYVQLVGVVVAFEEYYEKFWVFTIDDSSGTTIDINCRKPEPNDEAEVRPVPRNKAMKVLKDDPDAEARSLVMSQLDIGTVVQVKGTVGTFRDVRQVQLERITIVRDTNHEMQLIAARTECLRSILSKPWFVSPQDQKRLLNEAHGEADGENERTRRRRRREQLKLERDQRHADKIAHSYEREEVLRASAAEDARRVGLALKRQRRL